MVTDNGRLAGEPLQRGGRFCLLHTQIFNSLPAHIPSDARICYLDFETTGLDILSEYIVEIGLLDHFGSAAFSTVVRPPVLPDAGPTVHGIPPAELAHGPTFAEAFRRMVAFLAHLTETAVAEDSDSSCDEVGMTTLRSDPPALIIVAHNGFKFDIPLLMVECLRNGIGLEACETWYFVDTLHVLRAVDAEITGGCVKLQCLLTRLRAFDGPLAAHRALSDCYALRGVCQCLAAVLGVSLYRLFAPFCVALDKSASVIALSCVL